MSTKLLTQIELPADPSVDMQAATKQYVDPRAVPTGGTTGQVLAKASNTDRDLTWASSGGADEVAIQTSEPGTHPDLWVDTDDDTGTGGGGTVSIAKTLLLMGA